MLIPGTPAQAADVGDGKTACNSTEICFQWIWDSFQTSSYQKHFWYGDMNHGDNYWGNIPDLYPAFVIKKEAEGLWNRDSSCTVTVHDNTYGNQYAYLTINRGVKSDDVNARNWGHSRC